MKRREELILRALERHPLSAKEISEKTGIPLKTVYRLIKAMNNLITKEKKLYHLTVKGREMITLLE